MLQLLSGRLEPDSLVARSTLFLHLSSSQLPARPLPKGGFIVLSASTGTEPRPPRDRFPKPPFPQGKQSGSGSANELDPPADYGETTYQGHERLTGRAAIITGADSGIGT